MEYKSAYLASLGLMSISIFSATAAETHDKRAMQIDDLLAMAKVAEPTLSADGQWLAYQQTTVDREKHESQTAIYVVPADGSQPPRQLTSSLKKDSRPRFSPDGKYLVFQSNRSGSMQLWLIGLHGGEARQLTSLSTEASNAVWSPDGLKLAFVSSVRPEYSEKPFAESDLANREANELAAKNTPSARIFQRLFYRHWDSYVEGKRQHLMVIRLRPGANGLEVDGTPHDATPGDRDAFPTSSTFSSGEDFTFTPDSQHLIFTAVPEREEAWSTNYELCRVAIDNRSSRWELLTRNVAADSGPRFSPDGQALAWRSQLQPGYEADRWQLMMVATQADGKWLDGPVSLTAKSEDSVGEFAWLDNDQLVWNSDFRGAQRLLTVGAKASGTAAAKAMVEQQVIEFTGERGAYANLIAGDGKLAYVRSTMSQPGEVYIQSQAKESMNLSRANSQRLAALDLARPESIETIPIEGGRQMQMWLLKPPHFDPGRKYPVVYWVHGGPQSAWEDGWSFRWCPQLWAAQGYLVAMPNPRGSTGFGPSFVEEISGDWGGKCFRDLMAGADYVEGLPFVDKERIAAAGASFGGYMMNWFAVSTGRFRCLITHCSVWNFESMWGTTDELWFDEYEHGGLPWEKPEKYREFSPHTRAGMLGKFKTPMLVIHNDLDFRCPIGQGHELFAALQRQGVPSRFVNFPDEGHWVTKPANSRLWHQEVFAWLEQYCPPLKP